MESVRTPGALHALNRERRDDGDGDGALDEDIDQADLVGDGRIRCPLCAWRPRRGDLWMCTCACEWNTFDTRGRCPQCAYQWTETQCLFCWQWSRHEDWYERADPSA